MQYGILPYILLSEIISLVLIWKVSKWKLHPALKLIITLIPFIGPVLYVSAAYNPPHPNSPVLRGSGARGSYSHRWSSLKPLWREDMKHEKKLQVDNESEAD
ncbi:MAG: hypothetical protein ACI9GW_000515 [Halieaceae bacterium]